jgi:type IV pilus assembly protein PilZ
MTYNQHERRLSPRVQVSLQLHLVYDDLEELVEHYSHNLSEGGIFVETDEPLPVGTHVRLKISLVHQELIYIDAMGEVVHAQKTEERQGRNGMGVRFEGIRPEGQQFIREFVVSRLAEKSAPKSADKAARSTPVKRLKTIRTRLKPTSKPSKKRSVAKRKKKVGKNR